MSSPAGTTNGDIGGLRRWAKDIRRLVGVTCFGYDAFVSHARADGRDYALALWTALEDRGLTVCLDKRDFDAGDALASKLKGTVTASRALILLDTAKARGSKYVADEIGTAIAKRRRIVPIRGVGAESQPWLHLLPEQQRALDGLIRIDEPAEGFASGSVRVETVAAIRRSLSSWTTRRRLARLAMAVACLAAVAAALATLSSFATARVKALQWTLEDRGTPQRQAVAEVADFLAGPLFGVAEFVNRDDADRLLNQAVQASIKAERLDVPFESAVVSPFGGAVAVTRDKRESREGYGQVVEVRSPGGSAECATNLPAPAAAIGVDDAGAVLAVATADRIFAWQVSGSGCRPIVSNAAWRAPGSDRDAAHPADPGQSDDGSEPNDDDEEEIHIQVLPCRLAGLPGDLERYLVVWSEGVVVALHLTATGMTVSGRVEAGAFSGAGSLFELRASPGTRFAVLAGSSQDPKPGQLCVVPWSLAEAASCLELPQVQHLALDPSGRYLIVSGTDRTLRLYDLFKPLQEGPSVITEMDVRALAATESGNALAVLDSDGVLSLLDLPSLTPLARRVGFESRKAMLMGDFQRPAYASSGEVVAVEDGEPPASRPAGCVGRFGRVVAETIEGDGWVVRHVERDLTLPLTAVGVSRLAEVTVAEFTDSCDQLIVATTEGTRSELLVIDLAHSAWAELSLRRRVTRAMTGTISGVDVSSLAGGWIGVTLEIGEDVRVSQRVAVSLPTVLSVLHGDPSALDGHIALSVP